MCFDLCKICASREYPLLQTWRMLKHFFNEYWILNIEDGKEGEPSNGEAVVEVPDKTFVDDIDEPVVAIVDNTYSDLEDHL